jgi:predicted acetyltransferase
MVKRGMAGFKRSAGRKSTGNRLDLKAGAPLGFTSATDAVLLPKAKPWAMSEHFVVSSIRGREVARA